MRTGKTFHKEKVALTLRTCRGLKDLEKLKKENPNAVVRGYKRVNLRLDGTLSGPWYGGRYRVGEYTKYFVERDPGYECACGINLATRTWVNKSRDHGGIGEATVSVLFRAGDCTIPNETDGKFRVSLAYIEKLVKDKK